jgi:uncharacterized protein YndB with AHSA1/START domain
MENTIITIEQTIHAPVDKVWTYWSKPEHIIQWCQASDDWHAPYAENDLRLGGKFKTTMAAKDGSSSFDFEGVYTNVQKHQLIEYTMTDGRKVIIVFHPDANRTRVVETFEMESQHPREVQKAGWQAILDNFKKYSETTWQKGNVHFEIIIDAPAEKVYSSMIDLEFYKQWTGVFAPGSYFDGSWEKGHKILFLAPGENGGMVSRIRENIPNRYISIEHLGIVKDGKEITTGKEVESWEGATENYSYEEIGGKTKLLIDMDSSEEMKAFFMETWPKALEILKAICEAKVSLNF